MMIQRKLIKKFNEFLEDKKLFIKLSRLILQSFREFLSFSSRDHFLRCFQGDRV